jgi:hypothetical protein
MVPMTCATWLTACMAYENPQEDLSVMGLILNGTGTPGKNVISEITM